MSKEDDFDLEWDDDAFGGDIDFDDDFDMDPFKDKGFFASAGTGFLDSVTDQTIGSGDAIIRTARAVLPSSFSNFLDRASYINSKRGDLLREFKESNYESVKSLQSIAKNIAARIDNENSTISKKLTEFSETDYSDWEKYKSSDDDGLNLENVNQEEIDSELQKLVSSQTEAFQNVAEGMNEMQAHVGGGMIAAIKGGNKELIGVQAGVRDLLNYQRNVQYKMDQAKVEILARTYLVNAKYYKFMEKALHTSIRELKKITDNTGKSDYEKTSLYNQTKAKFRDGILGAVGKRFGGLVGELRASTDKDARENTYNLFESLFSNVDDALNMSEGITVSKGMIGSIVGSMIGDRFVSELPYMLNQGPFVKIFDNLFKGNPELKEKISNGWNKVRNVGNTLSYNSNNGLGLLNYYSQYWKDFDEYKYENYEDYVEQMNDKGEKPMPRAAFTIFNGLGNQAKGFVNRYMNRVDVARGTQYTLKQRDASTLTQVSQWREINNITLNDVIPGWLSRIYESMEKFRTGNDNFTAPVFSYNRGQFVDKKVAKQIVENDVFNHSSFQNLAINARGITSTIDLNNDLTDEQRQQLSLRIIQDADKEFGFNPYYYADEIEGFDPVLQNAVNKIIRKRFGITEEKLKEYNEAELPEKLKMAALGFEDEEGETLNTLGSLVSGLKNSIPNIGRNFGLNRQAGNEQILRDLGLIFTEDGVDKMNMDVFWNRLIEYLKNPYNKELKGDYVFSGEVNAGESRGFGYGNDMPPQPGVTPPPPSPTTPPTPANLPQEGMVGDSLKVFNESVEKFTKSINDLTDNIGNIDFSKVSFDLGSIPDGLSSLQSVLEKIDERGERQYTLIDQMTACVCRQAGGWGAKSDDEKKRIESEETQGKKSILDRLKSINPRGMFNKAVETLINNQPLVLGGIIGGLGTLALHDPKAAALMAGGIAIATAYGRLKNISRGETPNDDEDILDDTGTVLLHASKLRAGDYYDIASKKVIKAWKDITGAVKDIVAGTYITVAQLTGKIFGPDGRALIIKGLSKVKDALNYAWNKIDPLGHLGSAWDKGKEMFYQQDVYVKGEDEPRLTRTGFMNGKYYCYDLTSKQPFLIKGWNEIKGPVYELDAKGTLNQVITEAEIAQGLVTSTGIAINKLSKATSWLGSSALKGLLKAKDFTLEKAGVIKDKATDMFSSDYSGIESRLDRIYYLLCEQFGILPSDLPVGDGAAPPPPTSSEEGDIIEEIVKGATHDNNKKEEDGVKDKFNKESIYPNNVRLNSIQDQEQKEEKKKRNDFYEDIHSIRENMDGGSEKKEDGKEKKGFFGKISSLLLGGAGMLKKMFTNPLGFAADLTGMVFKSMIKSPLRLISIGKLLFEGVLGTGSAIYRILSWGFSGLMWGIRKLIWKDSTESFAQWFGGRRAKGKAKRGKMGKFNIKLPGGLGRGLKLAALGGLGYAAFGGSDDPSASAQQVANQNDGSYDKFYGDGDISPQGPEQDNSKGSTLGNVAETAAWMLGPDIALRAGAKGYQKYKAGKAAGNTLKDSGIVSKAGSLVKGGMDAVKTGTEGLGRVGGKLATAAGIKGGAKLIPGIGQALMALDGIMGFADGEAASNIFQTNYVTGKMRAANGITEILGLGGLVGEGMNALADITGFDFLKQDGGMTRLVEKGLDLISKVPIVGSPIAALDLFTSDLSTPQRKIRLAMYGIEETDNELAKKVETIEHTLEQYVMFNGKEAWIDNKAPIKDLIGSLIKLNPNDTVAWWKLRFEPVFKTWQSGIRLGGFESLFDFDGSKSPKVLKIAEQVRGAITAIRPFPLDVVVSIDPETPIMNRMKAEGMLSKYFKDLKDELGKDVDSKGNVKIENHIRTDNEVREGVSKDTGFFSKIGNFLQEAGTKLDDSIYPTPATVMEIDISDLHKDENTAVDELTLVRLAAYGNTENNSIRVDTILRLERYCEKFFIYQGGYGKFNGKIGEIYSLFKNSFRVTGYWEDRWITWFNNRFIPTLKVWYEEVYKLRNSPPMTSWKSLTATNRLNIATTLINTKTIVGKNAGSIWEIIESPFPGLKSGDDSDITKPFMTNLESQAVEAKLKTPDEEIKKSQPTNMQDNSYKPMDPEAERKMMESIKGGHAITRDATNTMDYNSSSQPGNSQNNIPGGGSNQSGQFGSESAGDFAGSGDSNYTPTATVTDKGFKISEKEAMKTIINEFVKQGITDNRVLAFALANAKVETEFQGKSESMNYDASRLPGIFKSTFGRNPGLAQKFGRVGNKPADQKAIANIAYGKKNGNQGGDDGWAYRGRGFTQLTFKDNYRAVGNAIGDNSIANNPERVTKDPVTAAKTEVGFFKIRPGIITNVEKGDIAGAAAIVGQHQDGINKKVKYYPEFLKRLTDGDLKSILNSSEKSEETKQNTEATPMDVPKGEEVNVAPIPKTPGSNPNDTVQQAADKVNAPPQDGSGEDKTTLATPVVKAPEPVPEPKEEKPAPVEKATTPTVKEEAVPVSSINKPTPVKEKAPEPVAQKVTLPDGVISVRDDAVVSAIAGLADAISRSIGSQGPGNRRVSVGSRS